MDEIRAMVFRTIKISIIVALVLAAVIFVLADQPKPMLAGLVLGSALGALNFYDLSLTMIRSSAMNPEKAKSFATRKYIFRYVFMGLALFISIRADYIHVLGTILGLMLIKFVIMATNLFNDKNYFKNIIKRKEDE